MIGGVKCAPRRPHSGRSPKRLVALHLLRRELRESAAAMRAGDASNRDDCQAGAFGRDHRQLDHCRPPFALPLDQPGLMTPLQVDAQDFDSLSLVQRLKKARIHFHPHMGAVTRHRHAQMVKPQTSRGFDYAEAYTYRCRHIVTYRHDRELVPCRPWKPLVAFGAFRPWLPRAARHAWRSRVTGRAGGVRTGLAWNVSNRIRSRGAFRTHRTAVRTRGAWRAWRTDSGIALRSFVALGRVAHRPHRTWRAWRPRTRGRGIAREARGAGWSERPWRRVSRAAWRPWRPIRTVRPRIPERLRDLWRVGCARCHFALCAHLWPLNFKGQHLGQRGHEIEQVTDLRQTLFAFEMVQVFAGWKIQAHDQARV